VEGADVTKAQRKRVQRLLIKAAAELDRISGIIATFESDFAAESAIAQVQQAAMRTRAAYRQVSQ
jgi:hypothetical protein